MWNLFEINDKYIKAASMDVMEVLNVLKICN